MGYDAPDTGYWWTRGYGALALIGSFGDEPELIELIGEGATRTREREQLRVTLD